MTVKYCSNCGEPLKEYAIVCSNCGKPVPKQNEMHGTEEKSETRAEEKVNAEQVSGKNTPRSAPNQTKNTFFAAILSFFVSGLGQVYNGQFWKGVGFMIAVPLGTLLLVVPGVAIWIWGVYDAYTESEKINNRELPYKEATIWEIIVFLLLPLIIGFAIALFAFLFFMMLAVPFTY